MDVSNIVGVIGLILTCGILFLGGNRGVLDLIFPAKLQFICLQPLKSNEKQVQGVRIFNKGGKLAENVKIFIKYNGSSIINDIQIEDEDNSLKPIIIDGGTGKGFVVLQLEKIFPIHRTTSRKPIIISITAQNLKDKPNIIIEYNKDKKGEEQKTEYERPLRDNIAIFIGIYALLWITFGNSMGVYAGIIMTLWVILNWIFSRGN